MSEKDKMASVTARVRIIMDVPAGSSWGHDCNLEQVFRQAERETLDTVKHAILNSSLRCNVTIISAEVTALAATNKEKK